MGSGGREEQGEKRRGEKGRNWGKKAKCVFEDERERENLKIVIYIYVLSGRVQGVGGGYTDIDRSVVGG